MPTAIPPIPSQLRTVLDETTGFPSFPKKALIAAAASVPIKSTTSFIILAISSFLLWRVVAAFFKISITRFTTFSIIELYLSPISDTVLKKDEINEVNITAAVFPSLVKNVFNPGIDFSMTSPAYTNFSIIELEAFFASFDEMLSEFIAIINAARPAAIIPNEAVNADTAIDKPCITFTKSVAKPEPFDLEVKYAINISNALVAAVTIPIVVTIDAGIDLA